MFSIRSYKATKQKASVLSKSIPFKASLDKRKFKRMAHHKKVQHASAKRHFNKFVVTSLAKNKTLLVNAFKFRRLKNRPKKRKLSALMVSKYFYRVKGKSTNLGHFPYNREAAVDFRQKRKFAIKRYLKKDYKLLSKKAKISKETSLAFVKKTWY